MGLAVQHSQCLRPKNLKSVVMETVVAESPPPPKWQQLLPVTPQNLINSRSSWGKYTLKIW